MIKANTLLALDSSVIQTASVALQVHSEISYVCLNDQHHHREKLLLTIEQLMRQKSLNLTDLDGFVWTSGPGTFIGLRVAASILQALSFTTHKPVYAVSTLRVMAQRALLNANPTVRRVLVAISAGQRRVYWGVYGLNDQKLACSLQDDCLALPESVPLPEGTMQDQTCLAIGEGWLAFKDSLKQCCADLHLIDIQPSFFPRADDALHLAVEDCLPLGKWVSAEEILPNYLYPTVAR